VPPHLPCALAFSALAGAVSAQPLLASSPDIGGLAERGCRQLQVPDCEAQRKRAELIVHRSGGYSIYGYERFHESSDHTFLDHGYNLGPHIRLGAQASWHMRLRGERLTWERGFQLAPQTALSIGAYAGRLQGSIGLTAQANLLSDAVTLSLPPLQWNAQTLALPALSAWPETSLRLPDGRLLTLPAFPGQDARSYTLPAGSWPGATWHLPAPNLSVGTRLYREGQTPYGGLQQAFETGFLLHPQWRISLNQTAQVGVDQINIGLGAALHYSSHAEAGRRSRIASICTGAAEFPAQGYRLSAGICSKQVLHDTLYEHEKKQAARLAGRINNRLSEYAQPLERFNQLTGQTYALPTYTGNDVLRWLDLESPYAKPKTSLNVQLSTRVGPFNLGLWYSHPLKRSPSHRPQTGIQFGYSF
jgi:hypothetical protein